MLTSKRGHKYSEEDTKAGKKLILKQIIKNWKEPVEFYIYDSDDIAMKLSTEFYLELLEKEELIKNFTFFYLPKDLKKPVKPEEPSDLAKWKDLEADSKYQKNLKQYDQDLFVYNEELKGQSVFIRIKKADIDFEKVEGICKEIDEKTSKTIIHISDSGGIYISNTNKSYNFRCKTIKLLTLLKEKNLNGTQLAKELGYSNSDKTKKVSRMVLKINRYFLEKLNLGLYEIKENRLIIKHNNGYGFNWKKYKIVFEK